MNNRITSAKNRKTFLTDVGENCLFLKCYVEIFSYLFPSEVVALLLVLFTDSVAGHQASEAI